MVFEQLLSDTVSLVKADGQRFDGIKASVQSNKIFTDRVDVDVEQGDIIERILPSGRTERFVVDEPGFMQGLAGIPPTYQMKVHNEKASIKQPTSVVYNLGGANARININSSDSSINIAAVDPSQFFQEMRSVAASSIAEPSTRDEILGKIDDLESAVGKPDFPHRYAAFISKVADHITLFSPFMPALGQILANLS